MPAKVQKERALAISIGNSRIKVARLGESNNRTVSSIATPRDPFAELEKALDQLVAEGDHVYLLSVVPALTSWFETFAVSRSHHLQVIRHADIPMRSMYAHPEELGIDRLVAAFGASRLYPDEPLIVIDLGTATTFNCVSAQGIFLGGAITLGIESTFHALHQRTAQLPEEGLVFPDRALATNPSDAIRAGVLFSGIAGIEGMIERLRIEAFSSRCRVILTGGLAALVGSRISGTCVIEPELWIAGFREALPL